MRLQVLGGGGVFPSPGSACGGYLVTHDDYVLLIDPGHGTMPLLAEVVDVARVDAVFISHGHPDHCIDLNALLRARAMRPRPASRLPVYGPAGALDAILALDRVGRPACEVIERFPERIGPFGLATQMLPHSVPNFGVRLTAGRSSLTYTGDAGPCDDLVRFAAGTDVLLCEATFIDVVPDAMAGFLNTALEAGRQAARAQAGRLVLTHLQPGTPPADAIEAAKEHFVGAIDVASAGLTMDLG